MRETPCREDDGMSKQRFRLKSTGWYRFGWSMLTGSVDMRTRTWIPYTRSDGVTLPRELECWIGPFQSFNEAVAQKVLGA